MGRIEAAITLESWLFGFRPCWGQGQFTIGIVLIPNSSKSIDSKKIGYYSPINNPY